MKPLLTVLAAALLAAVLWTGAALAQAVVDYDAWETTADRAEEVIEAARASDGAFEDLRSEIARYREAFLAAQSENQQRIATLQSQITALGPVPGEGETEPAELADRRAALTEQLARLRAPVVRAEEAYTRANGLIGEIDQIIRDRQAEEFLELGPTPLNPAFWPPALDDLVTSVQRSWDELKTKARSAALQAEARQNLPLILLLVILGVMLLARGKRWAVAGVMRLRGDARRGSGVWRFLVSLGQILLPFAGIWALAQAAFATQMVGLRWSLLLDHLPFWAMVLLTIRWLADQSFHEDDEIAVLPLDRGDRRQARALANVLALLYVLKDVLDTLIEYDSYPAETVAVLQFPLLALSGLLLVRLGRVRNGAPMAGTSAALVDEGPFRLRFLRLLGRAAIIIGFVGPAMAAIGYARFGEGLVYPFIATLALIGLVLVLQRFLHDLYALLAGRRGTEADGLLPVLAGFLLVLLALPALALLWGARVADLTELWTRFQEGFVLGETRISPVDFVVVLVVFTLGYMLTRLLQGGLRSTVLPKTKIDIGGQNAIVSGIGYVGIFVSAIVGISAGGLDLSSLAIVAGALSVGIGFGLQNIVQNFVSGIILLIERPISEGDWIEVGGQHGIVKDISVRSTRIETFDRTDVIVPNADFVSGTVTNYTRGNTIGRLIVPVGVAYGTDTRKVESILLRIARENDYVLLNPEPSVVFMRFGADALDFEIRAILRDVNKKLSVLSDMNHEIARRFAEEGIEIPFAQRDIWLRNPEALHPPAPAPRPAPLRDGRDDDASEDPDT